MNSIYIFIVIIVETYLILSVSIHEISHFISMTFMQKKVEGNT